MFSFIPILYFRLLLIVRVTKCIANYYGAPKNYGPLVNDGSYPTYSYQGQNFPYAAYGYPKQYVPYDAYGARQQYAPQTVANPTVYYTPTVGGQYLPQMPMMDNSQQSNARQNVNVQPNNGWQQPLFNTIMQVPAHQTATVTEPQNRPATGKFDNSFLDTSSAKKEAADKLIKLCNTTNYFICRKKRDGGFLISSGTFGAGVAADLNPKSARVYLNGVAPTGIPRYEESLRVKTNILIPVFIKVMQQTAGATFHIEAENTRKFARCKTLNGVPLGPSYYDIIRNDGTCDPALEDTIIQGLLDGVTATRAANYVRQIVANSSGKTVYYRDDLPTILMLNLTKTIFQAVLNLWNQNLMHCDLHFDNIMLLVTYLPSAEATRQYNAGNGIYSPQRDKTGPPGTVPIYLLQPNYVRFIDTAFLVAVTDTSDYRPWCLNVNRAEDLNELWRGGLDHLFKSERFTGKNVATEIRSAHTFVKEMQSLHEFVLMLPGMKHCQLLNLLRIRHKKAKDQNLHDEIKKREVQCSFQMSKQTANEVVTMLEKRVGFLKSKSLMHYV